MNVTRKDRKFTTEIAARESNNNIPVSLAYVGFTENDYLKMMLNEKGELIAKQKVARGRVASQEYVAGKMIEMVQERTYSRVFSTMGRLNFIVNRLAPWLSHLILKRYFLSSVQRIDSVKSMN